MTQKFRCIAVSSPSFSAHSQLVQELRPICERLVINEQGTKWTEDSLAQWLSDVRADGAVIGTDPLSKSVIERCPELKAVGKYGVGCDNVDIAALKERGIFFGWEGGVNRRSVSELALCFMLGHFRNIFRTVDKMQRAEWDKRGGVQLSGRTVGIVGLGFIGSDLASLLQPFGCKVLYSDIIDKSDIARDLGIEAVTYEELLRRSDVISFHVPSTSQTRQMFGQNQIERCAKHTLIVNTSRGNITDFAAVTAAVKAGRLGGYGSDVFPDEPLKSKDFSVESGFYFTPHIGGNAQEAVLAMGRSAIKGLKLYLNTLS